MRAIPGSPTNSGSWSGFNDAVSDSVAQTLAATPAARAAWLGAPDRWRTAVLQPFLARVRARLHVTAQTDSALDGRLAKGLAARVAEVRWGPDALEEFLVHSSPDVRAAVGYFPRLTELLAATQH
jgi:hypothetical protein